MQLFILQDILTVTKRNGILSQYAVLRCTWRVKRDTIPSLSWKTDLLQEFLKNTLSKLVAHTWSNDFEIDPTTTLY